MPCESCHARQLRHSLPVSGLRHPCLAPQLGNLGLREKYMHWTKVTSTTQLWIQWRSWGCMLNDADVCLSLLICFAPCLADFCLNNFAFWPCLRCQWDAITSVCFRVAKTQLPKTSRFLKPENGDSIVALLRQQHPRQFHLHKHVRGICKIGFAVFCLISSYDAMLVSLLSWLDFKLHQPLEGSWHSPMFLTSVSRLLIRNDWKLGLWWRLCFCGIPWSFPDAWGQQKLICNPFQCFPCISMHFSSFSAWLLLAFILFPHLGPWPASTESSDLAGAAWHVSKNDVFLENKMKKVCLCMKKYI